MKNKQIGFACLLLVTATAANADTITVIGEGNTDTPRFNVFRGSSSVPIRDVSFPIIPFVSGNFPVHGGAASLRGRNHRWQDTEIWGTTATATSEYGATTLGALASFPFSMSTPQLEEFSRSNLRLIHARLEGPQVQTCGILSYLTYHEEPRIFRYLSLGIYFPLSNQFRTGSQAIRGDVQFVTGDLDGDGIDEIIVNTSPGYPNRIHITKATNISNISPATSFQPFEPGFDGATKIAVFDMNADGRDDIIVSKVSGRGTIRIFNGSTLALAQELYATPPNHTGGVSITAGDPNGDGIGDLLIMPTINSAAFKPYWFEYQTGRILSQLNTTLGTSQPNYEASSIRLNLPKTIFTRNGSSTLIRASTYTNEKRVHHYTLGHRIPNHFRVLGIGNWFHLFESRPAIWTMNLRTRAVSILSYNEGKTHLWESLNYAPQPQETVLGVTQSGSQGAVALYDSVTRSLRAVRPIYGSESTAQSFNHGTVPIGFTPIRVNYNDYDQESEYLLVNNVGELSRMVPFYPPVAFGLSIPTGSNAIGYLDDLDHSRIIQFQNTATKVITEVKLRRDGTLVYQRALRNSPPNSDPVLFSGIVPQR